MGGVNKYVKSEETRDQARRCGGGEISIDFKREQSKQKMGSHPRLSSCTEPGVFSERRRDGMRGLINQPGDA